MKFKFYRFILPVLFLVLSFSCAFADAVYEPDMDLDDSESVVPYVLALLIDGISLFHLGARGQMLEKCGVSGWKIVIPFYGRYLEYKTYWKSKYFRINFCISIYLLIAAIVVVSNTENKVLIGILAILSFIAAVIYVIIIITLRMNSLNTFGYNRKLAFLELLCLGFILDFICGFSRRGRIEEKSPDNNQALQEHLDCWE